MVPKMEKKSVDNADYDMAFNISQRWPMNNAPCEAFFEL